ncbi:hypothetical protein [Alloyangia pacifica]|uniref:hypothetical protein n=1 Tax=Alloyangia pacifica TaxID=311180 RepID=UPI0031E06F75
MDQTPPSKAYGRYCVPQGLETRPAVKAVRVGGTCEPQTLAFMRAHAGGGDIVHVGTFFGDVLPDVAAAMLDFVIPRDRQVTIVQFDVEGHEKRALKSAYHLIHRCRRILILENRGNETWIQRRFRGLGHWVRGKLHGNFVYATEDLDL